MVVAAVICMLELHTIPMVPSGEHTVELDLQSLRRSSVPEQAKPDRRKSLFDGGPKLCEDKNCVACMLFMC